MGSRQYVTCFVVKKMFFAYQPKDISLSFSDNSEDAASKRNSKYIYFCEYEAT